MIMNLINKTLASMFRTNGAENKIEEKRMVRRDSLNTWDTDRFYPPLRYKYNHGLLLDKKETLIAISIKIIPVVLITAWILSKYL